jgi:ABC-type branched-subunit amino acid transport system substrate-binding protein
VKRKLFIVIGLLIIVSTIASGCNTAPETSAAASNTDSSTTEDSAQDTAERVKTLKLGFAGALTGGSAEQGTRQNAAMTLAVEEYNAARGPEDPIVEIVAYDDMADPKEAATVANKLASDPDVVAVIGHTNSSCTL